MAMALKAASGQLTRPSVAQVVRRQLLQPSLRRDVSCQASTAKFFVGGNWKANGTQASVEQLVSELNAGNVPDNVDVVVAPPSIYLERVKSTISSTYQVSAQNCWIKGCGAYTGEVTADMLKDADIPWVILGHSERRAMCGESNQVVGDKTAYALKQGLGVIACIGETLDQRNNGDLYKVLDGQLQAIADSIQDWSKVVIAYEPVWAIGTGVVATPAQAQEVHAYVRQWLGKKLGKDVAEGIRIIYGGSVNDANCEELAGQEDIDGFLVGGASLKGPSFVKICNAQANLSTARAA